MGNGTRKSYRVHVVCSILVMALLVAVPIVSAWSYSTAEGGPRFFNVAWYSAAGDCVIYEFQHTAGSSGAGGETSALEISEEDARQRLQGREVGWPESLSGGEDRSAAAVSPGVRVSIPYNTVSGRTGSANTGVTIKLVRGGIVVQTVATTTNAERYFTADLSAGNIRSGDRVRVTDAAGGPTVTINCTLTGAIDIGEDTVSGTAAGAENVVDVFILTPSTYMGDVPPGAAHRSAEGAEWSVNFVNDFSLRAGDAAFIYSTDAAGHVVMNVARSAGRLAVYPQYNNVLGFYQPGSLLSVKAGNNTKNTGTGGDGFFEAWFTGHNITPGQTVSCQMGADNRSITVAAITASYDPARNRVTGTGPANMPVRVTMDTYVAPVTAQGAIDGNGNFNIDLGLEGTVWFLAEGSTGAGASGSFETWVLVANPNEEAADVKLTYLTPAGDVDGPEMELAPLSRGTVNVSDTVPNEWSVSTMVTSDIPVVAERAMYWNTPTVNRQAAHDSIGVTAPAVEWFLAEGSTGAGASGSFETWVLVANPNAENATANLIYMTPAGAVEGPEIELAPLSRRTVNVAETVPNEWSVSTIVVADLPVVAERAMYWNTPTVNRQAAHDSIGVDVSSDTWFLAEGSTGSRGLGSFESWVLVANPNDETASVQLTYMTPAGAVDGPEIELAPLSRRTVNIADTVPNEWSVSTMVTSDIPVVAERAMYWNTPTVNRQAAHDSIGVIGPAWAWFLAEGSTGAGASGSFETWVLVANPNDEAVDVTLIFMTPAGAVDGPEFELAPLSRRTVNVADTVPNEWSVSTVVLAGTPVVAERAMYWNTPTVNRQAAHGSIGHAP